MKTVVTALQRIQTISFAKYIYAVLFLALVLAIPAISHQQLLTGTLVNATLLLAAAFVGPVEAIMIGLVPSLVALSSGTLPLPLAPAIPFIMMGNALFIYVFSVFRRRSEFGAIVLAALLKYGFLYLSTHLLLSKLLQSAILGKVIVMMSWPQLITALLGGCVAFIILRKQS